MPKPPTTEQSGADLYSRGELAVFLRISPSQVSKLIRKGRLKAVQTGFGTVRQHVRVTRQALEAFLAGESLSKNTLGQEKGR